MDSRSILRLIRYHWAIIVACALLGALGGWGVASLMPREYTASADVFVVVTGGSSTGEVAQSGNFSQQQARNFSAIATREVVLEQVIEDLDLDIAIKDLRKEVSTSVPLNTSVITISATDESPERAAAIANSVATHLSEVVPALTPRVDGESPVRLQVIEAATTPANPSSPNVPLFLILGLLGGLVVATVIVIVRGVVDAVIRTKEQVTEVSGLPVLASIAFDKKAAARRLDAADDRKSMRDEDYRQLRASLRFLQPGHDHKLFVFTSSMPGEGKSTTAANIAAALAASGRSVCLVDADMRRGTIGELLGLPDAPGLAAVLAGYATLDDVLMTWGPDDVHVLQSGDHPPNPSELLESEPAVSLFHELRERFDVTIVDSPPLNPVSDATVLASTLGGVIVVTGSRVTRVRDLKLAMSRLHSVGASVEGAVFNLARTATSRRYRYDYSEQPRTKAAAPAETAVTEAAPDPVADEPTTEPAAESAVDIDREDTAAVEAPSDDATTHADDATAPDTEVDADTDAETATDAEAEHGDDAPADPPHDHPHTRAELHAEEAAGKSR